MLSALMLAWCTFASGDHFQEVLLSVTDNQPLTPGHIDASAVIPGSTVPWKVTKRILHGGKQEGVEVIVIDNGKLQITVVPTRGMGIWNVTMGDLELGWKSPVEEIVHPKFVNLTARGGLGWLDGFGEWMCRCGLENNGHPGQDVIVDNTGAKSTVDLTLHGKQAYLPAQEVTLIVEKEPPYRITLRGRVDERMMHGPKLVLETELSTVAGSTSFHIKDTVKNASANPAEFQLLYHCNFGAPLLEKGSRLVAPLQRVVPMNDRAAEGDIKAFATYAGPTAGFVEQVFCLEIYGDRNKQTTVAFVNAAGDQGAAMTYSVVALPYLTVWKNTAAIEDGYVTGIEPGTNFPYNRRLERAAGRVPKLDPQGTFTAELEVQLLDDKEAVEKTVDRIKSIQADRTTDFATKPEPPVLESP